MKRLGVVAALVDSLVMVVIAVLAPIVGYYSELQLDLDEAVMLFPCGLLPCYCIAKVAVGRVFGCLWNDVVVGIGDRLSGYGSMKALVSPAKNGGNNGAVPDFGDKRRHYHYELETGSLSAAEEAVRQERRSRHGAGRSPSAPTTPRSIELGQSWHHRHHHWGGENAADKLSLPAHIKDPLAPRVKAPERTPAPEGDKKRFRHRSSSLAAADAGAIELPVYEMADPNSNDGWHRQKGFDGQGRKTSMVPGSGRKQTLTKKGDGGGGMFGFMRGKPPTEPTVPEERWSRSSWGSEESSPTKDRRKSRSNSFSLSLARRNRADKPDAVPGGRSSDSADVKHVVSRTPGLQGKGKGANSDDMYSA